MKKHVIDDAALLIFKGLFSGLSPASHLLKRFWKNFSKPSLCGFWALTLSCGVSAAPFAYIVNRDFAAPRISVIDTATNTLVTTIPMAGAWSVAVSPDGNFIYAAGNSQGVFVISAATNSVVDIVPIGYTPGSVVVSPDGAFVYATRGDGYVSVIATATRQVTANVRVEGGPYAIDISPDGAFVYVTNHVSLIVIATATNTVIATVFIGVDAANLAVSPDGAFVYVTRTVWDDIAVIATASNTVVAKVRSEGAGPYGNRSGPEGIAFSPDGAFVYVANFNVHNISKISTATGILAERIPSGGLGPTGVGVTPDGALLYVAHSRDDAVSVISTATRAVVATLKIGDTPMAFGRFIGPMPAGTVLATEGATFSVGAATIVRFGVDTRWVEKTVTGKATCSNAFFGGVDPAPGTVKSCVVGVVATPPPPPAGTVLAAEGATFSVGATATVVRFGVGTRWIEKTVIGTAPCTNAYFGGIDPAPGIVKSCVVGGATSPPVTGTTLAIEGGTFTTAAPTIIKYGAGTRWVQKTITGTAVCNNAMFGGIDPAPYVQKSCVVG